MAPRPPRYARRHHLRILRPHRAPPGPWHGHRLPPRHRRRPRGLTGGATAFGSARSWPAAQHLWGTEHPPRRLGPGPRRIFLFTYNPTTRTEDLDSYGTVHTLASAGGKTILTNH